MAVLRLSAAFFLALLLTDCSTIETLSFQPDRNQSGVTESQQVQLHYLANPQGGYDFSGLDLPSEVEKSCEMPPAYSASTTVIVATATAALDLLLGAIDGYRARLKQRAVVSYGATVVVENLALGATPSLPQCIIVTRYAENQKEPAMVLVNLLHAYKDPEKDPADPNKILGYTWNLAFLRVIKAAVEKGNPTIKFTQSLAPAAIQPHPGGSGSQVVALASEASFRLSKIELGQGYINRKLDALKENTDKSLLDLDVAAGPLFSKLATEKTIGSLAVNIIERGSASDFDDISAAEKSLREALRDAIGEELESRLGE